MVGGTGGIGGTLANRLVRKYYKVRFVRGRIVCVPMEPLAPVPAPPPLLLVLWWRLTP